MIRVNLSNLQEPSVSRGAQPLPRGVRRPRIPFERPHPAYFHRLRRTAPVRSHIPFNFTQGCILAVSRTLQTVDERASRRVREPERSHGPSEQVSLRKSTGRVCVVIWPLSRPCSTDQFFPVSLNPYDLACV